MNQEKIKISLVQEKEIPLLREIAIKTFTETFGKDYSSEQLKAFFAKDYTLPILTEELLDTESAIYFIRYEEHIAGYLKVNWGKAQTEQELLDAFEIQRIYVLRAYQGQGLGKCLFEFALGQAFDSGHSWAWLGVWEHNQNAQAFYQKYGFEKFSEHHFMVGDSVDIDWLMKKSLK